MKRTKKTRMLLLLISILLITLLAGPTISMAAQPTVDLGTTSTYAVLAGSAITNTGPTTINGDAGGDIGLFPGSAYTGGGTVTLGGTAHITDAAASVAQTDLTAAYIDAAGRTPVTIIPTELGGTTLFPGTYSSASGTFHLTGTLTLDAQGDAEGVFVFITASTLITASNSDIVLEDEARYCRTFWSVGSSATLGTYSHFVGHIFADESITATTGATVQGQLLAKDAVTLDSNTITNGFCDTDADSDTESDSSSTRPPTPPATLHVIKRVINDNGGTSDASIFNIHVNYSDSETDVPNSPAPGAESPGTTYELPPGDYFISEDSFAGSSNRADFAGYAVSYGGDADSSGKITLASGDNKTIIVTNDDIPAAVVVPPVVIVAPVTDVVTPIVPVAVPPTTNITETITGGELPSTASPWYNLMLVGTLLTAVGVVGWRSKVR